MSFMKKNGYKDVAVLGAGIQGACVALCLADQGHKVVLIDREEQAMLKASLWNEGKIHLGFLFANDAATRTAQAMIDGAEKFLPVLSRFMSLKDIVSHRSKPFVYAIPRDSILSVDAIENHFGRVCQMLKDRNFRREDYFDVDQITTFRKLSSAQVDEHYDRNEIIAAFQTPEVSIDTFQIASYLRDAIEHHPRIEFLRNAEIESTKTADAGHEETIVRMRSGDLERIKSDIVVNALWSDRLRFDVHKGLSPQRDFRFRFKLALHLQKADFPPSLTSTTLMLGAYGDLVTFPDSHIYLSWYPSCLQNSSNDIQPPRWEDLVTDDIRQKVRLDVFDEMSKRIPMIQQIDVADADIKIEGGTIFSWGSANISDSSDEVHQRVDIGLSNNGNYFSIDTGKYGMAPAFAEELANLLQT